MARQRYTPASWGSVSSNTREETPSSTPMTYFWLFLISFGPLNHLTSATGSPTSRTHFKVTCLGETTVVSDKFSRTFGAVPTKIKTRLHQNSLLFPIYLFTTMHFYLNFPPHLVVSPLWLFWTVGKPDQHQPCFLQTPWTRTQSPP